MLLDYILNDKYVVLDVETTSLNARTGALLSIAYWMKGKNGVLVGKDISQLFSLVPELTSGYYAACFHNANFDLYFLNQNGIHITAPIVDTLLLAQLVNENKELGLKKLTKEYFGDKCLPAYYAIENWRVTNKKKKGDYAEAPIELLKAYNLEDVQNTYKLARVLACKIRAIDVATQTHLNRPGQLEAYYEQEMQPVDKVLLRMSCRGIRIDVSKCKQKREELCLEKADKIKALEVITQNYVLLFQQRWHESILASYKSDRGRANAKLPKFNWDSTSQVGKLFFEYMGLQKYLSRRTDKGAWKCNELTFKDALEVQSLPEILREACTSYLSFIKTKTKLSKVGAKKKKGLLGKLENGRIYPSFKQVGGEEDKAMGTVTGRVSSSPNCQNQEEWEKEFYVPDE